jgi:branched-chain amino acid transport system substrate-binding protein
MTVSGADSITKLPHLGYVIRTQPNTTLQGTKHAEFIASTGAKRVSYMAVQTPFATSMRDHMREVLASKGVTMVSGLVYDANKNSYRSEVDQALRDKPDMIYLNSYTPDVAVLLRDLYRANYTGGKLTQSYAYTSALAESLPHEVTNGLFVVQPSGDVSSEAYAQAAKRLNIAQPDSYDTQATDWISLAILAIANAGDPNGEAIRDSVRKVSQGDGKKTFSAVEGLASMAKGEAINYEGASGPCEFDEKGDIIDCRFRFSIAENGKINFQKIL